jgi:hypothetical protein
VRVRNQSPTPCRHPSRCGSTPRASASASGSSLLWQPCCAYDGGHAARSRRVASQPRGAMRRPPWRLRSAIAFVRPMIRRTAQPPASTPVRTLTSTTCMSTVHGDSRRTLGNRSDGRGRLWPSILHGDVRSCSGEAARWGGSPVDQVGSGGEGSSRWCGFSRGNGGIAWNGGEGYCSKVGRPGCPRGWTRKTSGGHDARGDRSIEKTGVPHSSALA